MRAIIADHLQPLLRIYLAVVFLCLHLGLDNNSAMIQDMADHSMAIHDLCIQLAIRACIQDFPACHALMLCHA